MNFNSKVLLFDLDEAVFFSFPSVSIEKTRPNTKIGQMIPPNPKIERKIAKNRIFPKLFFTAFTLFSKTIL